MTKKKFIERVRGMVEPIMFISDSDVFRMPVTFYWVREKDKTYSRFCFQLVHKMRRDNMISYNKRREATEKKLRRWFAEAMEGT